MEKNKTFQKIKQITLGLSAHRPEMLPIIAKWMRQTDAIFLEEPPVHGFENMLKGSLSIKDYLLPQDMAFPGFSQEMCRLLRKLKNEGKSIFQVEPYLERLLAIHELFAKGNSPESLEKNPLLLPVYLAERNATKSLLSYYRAVISKSFNDVIKAVQTFARMDAARFRLRDALRADALAPLVARHASSFIETGLMHYPLWQRLKRIVAPSCRVFPKFLADGALKKIAVTGIHYGPGDLLTLLYVFHPNYKEPKREAILAARALIYSKLIIKEEQSDDLSTFPHLRDEIACIKTVRQLSLDDCRRLFSRIVHADTPTSNQIVKRYLNDPTPGK